MILQLPIHSGRHIQAAFAFLPLGKKTTRHLQNRNVTADALKPAFQEGTVVLPRYPSDSSAIKMYPAP